MAAEAFSPIPYSDMRRMGFGKVGRRGEKEYVLRFTVLR